MSLPSRNIAFFGSSLVFSSWNGADTYYHGIVKALAKREHRISFYQPDAYDRQGRSGMGKSGGLCRQPAR